MKGKQENDKERKHAEERRGIEKAKGEYPEIAEILDLLLKLMEISGDVLPIESETTDWDKLRDGFPVIDKRMLPKDLGPLMKRFKKVVEIILTGNADLATAITVLFERENLLRKLLEGVLIGRYDFQEDISHFKPLIVFAAGETLLPLINGIRLSAHPGVGLDYWSAYYCPICGASPNLSVIDRREKRLTLYCSRCVQDWGFPRLVCVNCGEKDQKKLHYFYAKSDESRRVHACDSCGYYIKSLIKREKSTVFPRLEDVTTMGLDIVAKKEGYRRNSVDFVGLILTDYEAKKNGQNDG